MTTQIRKALANDAGKLAEILRSLGWFTHLGKESAAATEERVRRHLGLCNADTSHSVYIAEVDGNVLGYLSVHWLPYLFLTGPEGYISELFLAEAARGQGIGNQLLKAAEAEARERGCSRLMLINNRGRESYQRQFYEKHGWLERPEMADFIFKLEK